MGTDATGGSAMMDGSRKYFQTLRAFAEQAQVEKRNMYGNRAYRAHLYTVAEMVSHATNHWHRTCHMPGDEWEVFLLYAFGGNSRTDTYARTIDATSVLAHVGGQHDVMFSNFPEMRERAEHLLDRVVRSARIMLELSETTSAAPSALPPPPGPRLVVYKGGKSA